MHPWHVPKDIQTIVHTTDKCVLNSQKWPIIYIIFCFIIRNSFGVWCQILLASSLQPILGYITFQTIDDHTLFATWLFWISTQSVRACLRSHLYRKAITYILYFLLVRYLILYCIKQLCIILLRLRNFGQKLTRFHCMQF